MLFTRVFRCFLVLTFLLAQATTGFAAPPEGKGKGNGGGDDGGGSSPNLEYEVLWLGTLGGSTSRAIAATTSGEIVGSSDDSNGTQLATRFTLQGPVDLNVEMADLLTARDDGPWFAWVASGINDLGQITGSIKHPGGTSHPFIYDPGDVDLGRARHLTILPQLFADTTRSWGINDFGEIMGDYWGNGGGSFAYTLGGDLIDMGSFERNGEAYSPINNAGQIAFASGRYTPTLQLGDSGTFEPFPFWLNDINGSGVVVGHYRTTTKKGRNKYIYTIYRGSTPDATEVIYQGDSAVAPHVNDHGDVCFTAEQRLVLHRDGVGLISIDAHVVGDDGSVSSWLNADYLKANDVLNPTLDESGGVGYPVIVGYANLPGLGVGEAFVLLPYSVQ